MSAPARQDLPAPRNFGHKLDAGLYLSGVIVLGLSVYLLLNETLARRSAATDHPVVATLDETSDVVRTRSGAFPVWESVGIGHELREKDHVFTGSASGATLKMKNATTLVMSESSLVVVELLADARAMVDVRRGSVLVSAVASDNDTVFKVNGAVGVVGARSSEAVVSVAADGTAEITVLKGSAKVKGAQGEFVIQAEQRHRLDARGLALGTTSLAIALAAPAWGAKILEAEGEAIGFSWRYLAPLTKTLLEVSRDAAFATLVRRETVHGTGAPLADLPAGSYYWRVTGETAAGVLERSDVRKVDILALVPPRLRRPLPDETLAAPDAAAATAAATVFDWDLVDGATEYELQLAGDAGFQKVVTSETRARAPLLVPRLGEGRFFWRMRARFRDGRDSGWSEARALTSGVVAPPAVPRFVEPVDAVDLEASTAPSVAFVRARDDLAASGDLALQIQLATAADFSHATAKRFAGAAPRWTIDAPGIYFWRARAEDRFGRASAFTTPRRLAVRAAPARPEAPASGATLTRAAARAGRAFRWQPCWGCGRYVIQVAADPAFSRVIARAETGATTNYTWADAAPGTYHWRVQADGGVPGEAVPFTVAAPAPLKPPRLDPEQEQELRWKSGNSWPLLDLLLPVAFAAGGLGTTAHLNWPAVEGAHGYRLQIAHDAAFTKVVTETTVNAPFFVWDDAPPGRYFYRVAALDEAGAVGEVSNVAALTLKLPTPALASPASGTPVVPEVGGKVTFAWKPVDHAITYAIEVAPDPGFSTILLREDGDGTSATLVLGPGAYFWRVRAIFPENYESLSAVRTLAVVAAAPGPRPEPSPEPGPNPPDEPKGSAGPVAPPAPPLALQPRIGVRIPTMPGEGEASVAFSWKLPEGAMSAQLQVARDAAFDHPVVDRRVIAAFFTVRLPVGAAFWRVRALGKDGGHGPWTGAHQFAVVGSAPAPAVARGPAPLATRIATPEPERGARLDLGFAPGRLAYEQTSVDVFRRVDGLAVQSVLARLEVPFREQWSVGAAYHAARMALAGSILNVTEAAANLGYRVALPAAVSLGGQVGASVRDVITFRRDSTGLATSAKLERVVFGALGLALSRRLASDLLLATIAAQYQRSVAVADAHSVRGGVEISAGFLDRMIAGIGLDRELAAHQFAATGGGRARLRVREARNTITLSIGTFL